MEWVLLAGLLLAPVLARLGPAPGLGMDRDELRALQCERLALEAAVREEPGRVRPGRERGDYMDRSALRCRQDLVPPGLRPPRDEAVLSTLGAQAQALGARAVASTPRAGPPPTWLVQAHLPDPAVAEKLRVATQLALVAQGQAVSDRRPLLSPHQVEALAALPPAQAWPEACRAWAPQLGPGEALLVVLVLDRDETALHAGRCAAEGWSWLS
ncbi:hypothetical protein L6R53_26820 [Myxococcota bacterium]|nr:hypothetical protein [Myxococcota bacterium]